MAPTPTAAPTLDSDQQKAAHHSTGRAAVAAAAGSGKTTLLVGRAIDLVRNGADPASVLTLAFNRNAAITLRARLAQHPATAGHEQKMASTFHAFALSCVKLVMPKVNVLSTSAEEAASQRGGGDGSPRKTVRDVAKDAWESIGGKLQGASRPEALRDVELDTLFDIEPAARERLFSAGWPQLAGDPTRLKAELEKLDLPEVSATELAALALYMPAFLMAKRRAGSVDFTDMLIGLGAFIRKQEPAVMTRLRTIRHLQVDEAQDGNELRWYIARTIAEFGEGRSVMAVGDLRQSIAGFAGAEPELFRRWWDQSTQFTLPRNYRSAAAIVEAGNLVAKGEDWNVGGDAIAAREDLGKGSIRVEALGALAIGVEVATAINNGTKHKDITVLARTRAALETAAFAIRTRGLKVFVRGGGGAWRGIDGRNILAYLRFAEGVVARPGREFDKDLRSLTNALNRPLRYVSGAKVREWMTADGKLNSAALYREAGRYPPAERVVEAFEELSGLGWAERVQQVRDWLIEGMEEDVSAEKDAPGSNSDRADLIEALCGIAEVCGSMENLNIAIAADQNLDPTAPDVIELSTIHQAKGDQWGTVYVTGVKEGVFPHIKAKKEKDFAEEVRLLYVAVTRPVHTLVLDVEDMVSSRFETKLLKLEALAKRTLPAPPPEPEEPNLPTVQAPPLVSKGEIAAAKAERLSAKKLVAALGADEERAAQLTKAAPAPAAGERFVRITWQELVELLTPHGFKEEPSNFGQRIVSVATDDEYKLLVYTTVPPGHSEVRSSGSDSMRVVLLKPDGKPMPKLTPLARTRNWRRTLLNRLAEALTLYHPELKAS